MGSTAYVPEIIEFHARARFFVYLPAPLVQQPQQQQQSVIQENTLPDLIYQQVQQCWLTDWLAGDMTIEGRWVDE